MKRWICDLFGRLKIKNKILVSCLPFVIISYIIIFFSITVIMFNQLKSMVYNQTEQNIIEKTNLINTTLSNYAQATAKFLYYSDEVQEYLNTRQSTLSEQEVQSLRSTLSYNIASLLTNNQPTIMNISLYNKYDELYINNAIYANTISQTEQYARSLADEAANLHGKPMISRNPFRGNVITISRNVYVPRLEQSNEKIGFLMVDINKSDLANILKVTQNTEAISIVMLDKEQQILINSSSMSDQKCREILEGENKSRYLISQRELIYGDCRVVGIIDEKLLFQDTYRIFFMEIAFIFLAVLIILFAILFTGNTISRQLHGFICKVRQTTEIDTDAYIHVDTQDEFRELADVYNGMLTRIDTLIQTVYLKEILAKDAQIESLQAQINPHFLYNTLDCICSLASMGETEKVKKTVTSLSSIMRMSIKGDAFLQIGEDLEHVRQYLYIQKIRFQDNIIFLIEIPERMYGYYIPKLTLQPLLENAIQHGVASLKETGMIVVSGEEDEDSIYLTVKDNGVGMPKEIMQQLAETGERGTFKKEKAHIGIFNIQQRIRLLYGKEYGITVKHLKPSGSSVTIHLPKIRDLERRE